MEILDIAEQWCLVTELLVVVVVVFIDRLSRLGYREISEIHHIQILAQLVLPCDLIRGRENFSSIVSLYFQSTVVDSTSKDLRKVNDKYNSFWYQSKAIQSVKLIRPSVAITKNGIRKALLSAPSLYCNSKHGGVLIQRLKPQPELCTLGQKSYRVSHILAVAQTTICLVAFAQQQFLSTRNL